MVPSISLLRFQKDIIKTPLSSVKTLLVKKLLLLFLALLLGNMAKVMFDCRMQLAWTLLKPAMTRLKEFMEEHAEA